jgi:uracil-DNA glycosylase
MSELITIDSIDSFKESWKDLDIRNAPIRKSWQPFFNEIFKNKNVITGIEKFIEDNEGTDFIFPHKLKIFNCFNGCKFNNVKVVIIGQDPYHSLSNQAQGFAFLVPKTMKYPPSLLNIQKEVKNDVELDCDNLENWIDQGVLLMNASITVKPKNAGSHLKYWEPLTNEIIKQLSSVKKNLVFMLWGQFAKSKTEFINKNNNHLILTAGHPSPLADQSNWINNKHFSKTNTFLRKYHLEEIFWGNVREDLEEDLE